MYSATKHAIRCIAESLHEEISPLGLASLVFEPGYFRTDLLIAENHTKHHSKIPDYEQILRARLDQLDGSRAHQFILAIATDRFFPAANHNQLGDAKKGANVIIDVVKSEGVAKDKAFTPVVLLGSDCYDYVRKVLTEGIEKFDEWKDITTSTDRDDA